MDVWARRVNTELVLYLFKMTRTCHNQDGTERQHLITKPLISKTITKGVMLNNIIVVNHETNT